MVKIQSPENASPSSKSPFKTIPIILAVLFIVFLLINSLRISQVKNQVMKVSGILETSVQLEEMIEQNNLMLQEHKGSIRELKTNVDEAGSRTKATGDDFGSFKVRTDEQLARLQRETDVLLLNSNDFVKMFEAVQDDLATLRQKGVLISYKADAGSA